MDYTSLIGPKGRVGSIQNWFNYSQIDSVTVLDEAQSLLYSLLRTREMQTLYRITLPVGSAKFPLPTGFLEGIGRMYASSINLQFRHKDHAFVVSSRNYNETTGTLGTDPFTTIASSNLVTVTLPNHGFAQESVFYTTGATAVNGATIVGTFNIDSITDANNFVIDITPLGTTPFSGGSGGGSAVTYQADNLTPGSPLYYGIWDEAIHFDQAFFQQMLLEMPYYKAPTKLGPQNTTNFLTSRYPQLVRVATLAMAADYANHDGQYQRQMQRLEAVIQQVNIENDMQFRGAELDTDTP